MLDQPLVSILTNSKNGAIYLKELFQTIDNQTYKNWEHIFFDNNSTDETHKITLERKNKLRYFKSNQSLSLPTARNLALKKCRGKYIAILDCDDLWKKEKLELQIRELEKFKEAPFCSTDYVSLTNSGILKNKSYKDYNYDFRTLLSNYSVSHSSVVFRSESIRNLDFIYDNKIQIANDKDLLLRLLINKKYCNIEKPLTFWRMGENSTMLESLNDLALDNKKILEKLENIIPNFYDNYKNEILKNKLKIRFHESIYHWKSGDSPRSRKIIKDLLCNKKFFIFYLVTFTPKSFFPFFLKFYIKFRNFF